ncbi:acyl carrier protein [Lacrimispora brassicae]
MNSLYEEVKKTIVDSLNLDINVSEIGDDVLLFDGGIGLDSVDGLELLVAIERKFDIEIDDTDLGGDVLKNVNSLVAFIENKRMNTD